MDFITEVVFYKKHKASSVSEIYFAQGESTSTLELIANIIVIIAQFAFTFFIISLFYKIKMMKHTLTVIIVNHLGEI